jgi:hypothetical protein
MGWRASAGVRRPASPGRWRRRRFGLRRGTGAQTQTACPLSRRATQNAGPHPAIPVYGCRHSLRPARTNRVEPAGKGKQPIPGRPCARGPSGRGRTGRRVPHYAQELLTHWNVSSRPRLVPAELLVVLRPLNPRPCVRRKRAWCHHAAGPPGRRECLLAHLRPAGCSTKPRSCVRAVPAPPSQPIRANRLDRGGACLHLAVGVVVVVRHFSPRSCDALASRV